MASFLNPLLRAPGRPARLTNTRHGGTVAADVQTAFDSKTRNKGLLGRDGLPEGSALVIAPSNAIHTFFMRFPIDVAFVARDGRVLKTRAAIPAWRLSAAWRAFAVIEVPAGTLARTDTVAGDVLGVDVDGP